jgi:metal-sulfur cluster biosynthetic enzyme/nitrite reductase/ring-hydroxylating ferredoxin subunit
MSEFVRVAKMTDLADPGRLLLEVEDRIVVLFRVGGELFCIDDVCTHDGGPLSDGQLDNQAVACPRHGAKFDIRTGKALTMPATVDTAAHEVRVAGDEIFVKLCEVGRFTSRGPVSPPLAATQLASTSSPAGSPSRPAQVPSPTAEGLPSSAPTSTGPTSAPPLLSEELVREELKKVIDPELFVNIVDLGLIYNVDLLPAAEGKSNCKIDMTMTSPMCPAGPQMIQNSKQVLGLLAGMGDVEVKIVLDPPWTPDKMTQEARDQLGIF